MLKSLISSKSRRDILALFLSHPDEEYYQNQLASVTGHPIRAIQRELANLTDAEIVAKKNVYGRVLYTINKDCVIYQELRDIFLKTVGVAHILTTALKRTKGIEWAFLYGSFSRGAEGRSSDIDLIVIGDISARVVSRALRDARKKIEREINYTVFDRKEIISKHKNNDVFIRAVVDGPIEMLIGDPHEFKKIFTGK